MLQQWCFAIEQQNFCINILENELQQFQFKLPHLPINSLQQIIPNLLKPISENYLTKQA